MLEDAGKLRWALILDQDGPFVDAVASQSLDEIVQGGRRCDDLAPAGGDEQVFEPGAVRSMALQEGRRVVGSGGIGFTNPCLCPGTWGLGHLCILSDRDIRERLEKKLMSLEPYIEKHLTPNGYDLTVKEVLLRTTQEKTTTGDAVIPPMSSFLISTKEYVKMPADAAGQLWIRSSYARRGILAAFGKVEAGFEGELTVGCFNSSHEAVKLPIGDRFCQLAFEKMHSLPDKLYKEHSGNYQGQRGVTLAR